MNPVTCSALLLLAALLVQAAPTDDHWTVFKQQHGHRFSDIESRKDAYLAAKARVDKHNAEAEQGLHPYTMAVYPHSIMTEEEKSGMFGDIPNAGDASDLLEHVDSGVAAPVSLDLRTNKCMGAVQDQNPCGSCYSFSAVATIDYQYCQKMKLAKPIQFSPQQTVDCSIGLFGNNGCSGGSTYGVHQYIQSVGGLMTMANYPYQKKVGQCVFNANKAPLAKVQSVVRIPGGPNAVDQMKNAITTYGPISVSLLACKAWSDYKGGVYVTPCATGEGHAVNVVGWGTEAGTGRQYWIVRNSWDAWWGEQGYMRHLLGVDLCTIESRRVTYPIIA